MSRSWSTGASWARRSNDDLRALGRIDLVQTLSGTLPMIDRLADEHAFRTAIPPIARLVERTAIELGIRPALRSRQDIREVLARIDAGEAARAEDRAGDRGPLIASVRAGQ